MDHTLRCNELKCRAPLSDEAVVTTCSHIFCVNCAESHGFFAPPPPDGSGRICPACRTQLTAADDAVHTKLNPPEDYKTSVLSGLNPAVIIECASRALSFWNYQMTQEIVYQEWQTKTLTTKYQKLNSEVDKIVHDATDEIRQRDESIEAMSAELATLKQKHYEMGQTLREEMYKHQSIKGMYDRLKKRSMLSEVQTAATNAVEQSVLGGRMGDRSFDEMRSPPPQRAAQSMQLHMPPVQPPRQPLIQLSMDRNGVEQLHPHQRSGSAGSGHSDKRPPREARQSQLRTSFTPAGSHSVRTSIPSQRSRPVIPRFPMSMEANSSHNFNTNPHSHARTPLQHHHGAPPQLNFPRQTPRQGSGYAFRQGDGLPNQSVKMGRRSSKSGAFGERMNYR